MSQAILKISLAIIIYRTADRPICTYFWRVVNILRWLEFVYIYISKKFWPILFGNIWKMDFLRPHLSCSALPFSIFVCLCVAVNFCISCTRVLERWWRKWNGKWFHYRKAGEEGLREVWRDCCDHKFAHLSSVFETKVFVPIRSIRRSPPNIQHNVP